MVDTPERDRHVTATTRGGVLTAWTALFSEEGDVTVIVPVFSNETRRLAAAEAACAKSGIADLTDDEYGRLIVLPGRYRQHLSDQDGDEMCACEKGWWCEYGDGPNEVLGYWIENTGVLNDIEDERAAIAAAGEAS